MKTYPTLFCDVIMDKVTLRCSLTVFCKGISCLVSHVLLMHGLHGAWCSFQGSLYMLYLLVLDCRGGGLYVICAKSVTQLGA